MKFGFNKAQPFEIEIIVVVYLVGHDVDSDEIVVGLAEETS